MVAVKIVFERVTEETQRIKSQNKWFKRKDLVRQLKPSLQIEDNLKIKPTEK